MRKLVIALLSAASISAAVSTASASTASSLTAGLAEVHQIGWQHAIEVADCSGTGCKYEEPQDPLASPEDGKPISSPDAVQDCGGGTCAKPERSRSMNVADCTGSGCKYEEPQDPLASPEDGKRNSSSDPVQDCGGSGSCAKSALRSVNVADCSGTSC
jgi:hypothetical protein